MDFSFFRSTWLAMGVRLLYDPYVLGFAPAVAVVVGLGVVCVAV